MNRYLSLPAALLLLPTLAVAGNWPQWRGPNGDSVSDETNLPVKWSNDAGIVWKCPLPGPGSSTPAIWGNAVFVTCMQGEKYFFLKINKADGKIEWSKEIGSATMRRGNPKRKEHTFHNLHNLASPSPVTDGELVVVHFGTGDLLAFDFAGKELWRRNLQKEHGAYTIWWGHANSPVLYKDLVINVCMQDNLADLQANAATSYLVAHDKKTGVEKWKVLRMTGSKDEDGDSYTTPVFRTVDGKDEMIVTGANQVDAYDPATGKQLWYLPNVKGSRLITGPALGKDMLYTVEGKKGALLAIKLTGNKGKLGDDVVAWKHTGGTPDSPCAVLWKDLIFTVSDDGFAQCYDAKTGELKWKERLAGDYKASPLAADGRVYFLNLAGKCTVVAASAKFDKLAENQLDDRFTSSPAVSDGKLFLHGDKALYCIGAK